MKKYIRIISLILSIVIILVSICSCNISVSPLAVKAGEKYSPKGKNIDKTFVDSMVSFSSELLINSLDKDKNTFISPYSVVAALALAYNGSANETKMQFEKLMNMDMETLNEYFYTYNNKIASYNSSDVTLLNANSIWVNEPYIDVNEDFLQKTMSYYDADIYREDLYKEGMVDAINDWCYKNTGHMIKEIIKEISPNVVMYLMNAIYFDAQWAEKYESNQITSGEFTNYDGTKSSVKYLSSEEAIGFKGKDYVGVKKNYKGDKFSFVAILPDEQIDIYDFVNSLDYEKYDEIMSSQYKGTINTKIPKMKFDFDIDLKDILSNMGLDLAFDEVNADFSEMGDASGNVYMSKVKQKTALELDENGTKASAITIIEMQNKAMPIFDMVYLNRPFVMFIVDNETNIPIFSGVITNL